jgi:hypothetical protein
MSFKNQHAGYTVRITIETSKRTKQALEEFPKFAKFTKKCSRMVEEYLGS